MASSIPEPPDMDEFAQTRGADDLFDDEIIPVSEEQAQESQEAQPEAKTQEPQDRQDSEPQPPPSEVQREAHPKTKRGGRGIWRGKRRAERTEGKAAETPSGQESEAVDDSAERPEEQPVQDDDTKAKSAADGTSNHVPAVRGDRSATGGVRKPKLTDEELDKRIASAREQAAKVSAAHARAQADLESFLEREKVENEKRRVEGENRRVMNSERDQNRQRKLKALTGREWDATKREEDYSPRSGRGQYRRGMYGAVAGPTRRSFEQHETADRNQHNARGRRGRGGRRGSPRGNSPSAHTPEKANEPAPSAPAVSSGTEFPALGEKKETELGESKSPVGDWAEQMEADRE